MRFSPDFLEQLRGRIVLTELIGQKVKLARAGRLAKGLCPFHGEKTPSFYVYDDQENYHCYGCGVHGDAISFVKETEGLSFQEAVERLAVLAGLPLPQQTPITREERSERALLLDALEVACGFFQTQLRGKARDYFGNRGFSEETVAQFRLGYAPRGNLLKETLLKKGFQQSILIKAGLIIEKPETGETYDRFRDRIMFPIFERSGKVIAFGGRVLGEGEPKYLNSPETPVFHKGSELYAAHFARSARGSDQPVILCEGYTDVLALHQEGWHRAVAPLGTALTDEQIQLLWRFDPEPFLCFDGDEAGQRAAARAAYRALPLLRPRYSLRFVTLPKKEDPASLLQSGNLSLFKTALENARPLSDLLWQVEIQNKPLNTPEQKAYLQKSLNACVEQISDGTVKGHYKDLFREKLSAFFWSMKVRQRKGAAKSARNIRVTPYRGASIPFDPEGIQRKILFATVLNHPEILDEVVEQFVEIDVSDPFLKKLQDEIIFAINDEEDLDESGLKDHLYGKGLKSILDPILSEDIYLHGSFASPDATPQQALEGWKEIWRLYRAKHRMDEDLQKAQQHLSEEMSLDSWRKIQRLRSHAMDQGKV